MKPLFLLGLGALCGMVATVLFFTVDPTFDTTDADGAGGGNVSLSFGEEALAALVAEELATIPAFSSVPVVEATVGSNGLLKMNITLGGLGVALRSSITLNPNIVNGKLELQVVEANTGDIALPEEIADLIERALQERLDALADGLPYRLTAIVTTERRLTLDIEI